MKQSAVKTLGVAALGAAFASAAAGTASAAAPTGPAALVAKSAVTALDTVGSAAEQLPLEQTAEQLPAPASDVVQGSKLGLGTLRQVLPIVFGSASTAGTASPLNGLLGGLPVNGLAQGASSVNGLPLGG
ncbi:ATP-binding protein [Streptomyces sp. NPDC056244]|uniref:ATP-binding protein n=1 Tax=unclassified Streptomyces TaxID=2593676 RepID=UPI0035D8BABD